MSADPAGVRAARGAWRVIHPILGPYRRNKPLGQLVVGVAGLLLVSAGLLGYFLVSPEIPFADAKTTLIKDVRAGDAVKVYGRIDCNCTLAINRTEERVGIAGRDWNATYSAFLVVDPSGAIFIDTDSVTILRPGPEGGDYPENSYIAVYGHVYDQGNGVLALRAQMIAKNPTDSVATAKDLLLSFVAIGAFFLIGVAADRVLFGAPRT